MYSCACSYPDDVADIFEEVERKAAKPHKCFECEDVIERGEKHKYVSSLYDGRWSHWRTCLPCRRIGRDLCGGCWSPGMLWYDLWESNGLRPDEAPTDNDGWYFDDEDLPEPITERPDHG